NTFTIVATNSLGKSTSTERTILFNVSAPVITFTNSPEVTNQKQISIQGNVKGHDSNVKLYMNDQEVHMNYNKNFSIQVTLTEGDNTFVFRAVNSYGKSTSLVKTIRYAEIVPPSLFVHEVPHSSNVASITITGTVSDHLDPNAVVYV